MMIKKRTEVVLEARKDIIMEKKKISSIIDFFKMFKKKFV